VWFCDDFHSMELHGSHERQAEVLDEELRDLIFGNARSR